MTKRKEARDRAEASFKKKEHQALEAEKARAEYDAEGRAVGEKTARLKALRLAKEASVKEASVKKTPPERKPTRHGGGE